MHKSGKRWAPVGIFVLVLMGAAALYWKDLEPTTNYAVTTVERGDILQRISLVGTVRAKNTVEVGAEVSGKIQNILVEENQSVSKGDILAIIAPETFENATLRARATLLQAEASKDRQQAVVRGLSQRVSRRKNTSAALAFSVEELEALEIDLEAAEADLRKADAVVQLAQSELERSLLELKRTTIRSPSDGIILERRVEPGQTVNASLETPVLFVVASDLKDIEIVANVDEVNIGKINTGQTVSFYSDAYEDKSFAATVERARQVPTPDLNYVAYPVLFSAKSSPEAPLIPGMTVNIVADLITPVTGVVRIPVDATRYHHQGFLPPIPDVVKQNLPRDQWQAAAMGYDFGSLIREGKTRIFVLTEDQVVEPREVKLGASNYEYVEIVAGDLAEGEKVILGRLNYDKP